MASLFDDAVGVMLDGVYGVFGDPVMWRAGGVGAPVACAVRKASADEVLKFGGSDLLADTELLFVRRSEILSPKAKDTATFGDGVVLKVLGEPRRLLDGQEWACQAKVVSA